MSRLQRGERSQLADYAGGVLPAAWARGRRHARAVRPRLCARRHAAKQVLPVGITMGDAAGIGPEIVVKALRWGLAAPAVGLRRRRRACGAPRHMLGRAARHRGNRRAPPTPGHAAGVIQVVACHRRPARRPAAGPGHARGRPRGLRLCVRGHRRRAWPARIRAIVTAPLNKAVHVRGRHRLPRPHRNPGRAQRHRGTSP